MLTSPPVEREAQAKPVKPGEIVLRNAWFSLAQASSVKAKKPLARMIDSTPIVLWRDRSDRIHAMEDRCCHRRAPLSAGKVVDDVVQCAYHGWCYDCTGSVVKIPSLGPGVDPPTRFSIPTYPVRVRYGMVWVWWGDPAAADPTLIPDIPFLDPDGTPPAGSCFTYPAPSELVVENLLDLTHVDFIHGTVFGDPFGGVEEITVEHTDEVILMRRISRNRRPPKMLAPMMGNPERQDMVQTFLIHVRTGAALGIAWNTPPGWGFCLYLPNTPETPTRTREDGAIRVIGPKWYQKIAPIISTKLVTRQDAAIFRLQTPNYQLDDPRADKSVPADAASLRYHAMRNALIERQRNGDFEYRDGWRGVDAREAIFLDGPPPAESDT